MTTGKTLLQRHKYRQEKKQNSFYLKPTEKLQHSKMANRKHKPLKSDFQFISFQRWYNFYSLVSRVQILSWYIEECLSTLFGFGSFVLVKAWKKEDWWGQHTWLREGVTVHCTVYRLHLYRLDLCISRYVYLTVNTTPYTNLLILKNVSLM